MGTNRCKLTQNQMILLALTFVMVIIVVLVCRDTTTALIIIGLLLGFYAAYLAQGASDPGGDGEGMTGNAAGRLTESGFDKALGADGEAPACSATGGYCPGGARTKEGYSNPLPGAPAPYAVMSTTRVPEDAGHYPGAIDIDEYDSRAEYGFRDRTEGDNGYAAEGNPFDLNRISSPAAADACVDDEANDAEIDGDELNTYHARSRNDATRVTAGTMNRRRDLDKYFREELEEEEDRAWWGRHEE